MSYQSAEYAHSSTQLGDWLNNYSSIRVRNDKFSTSPNVEDYQFLVAAQATFTKGSIKDTVLLKVKS